MKKLLPALLLALRASAGLATQSAAGVGVARPPAIAAEMMASDTRLATY